MRRAKHQITLTLQDLKSVLYRFEKHPELEEEVTYLTGGQLRIIRGVQ